MNSVKKPRLGSEELFQMAVRALAARSLSSGELALKLRRRAARVADVDATIARLREIGYLDDKRFAESYAAARVENDGFGRQRILTDLRGKRIAGAMAEKAVAHALEGKNEAELIETFIERRMPGAHFFEDDRRLASAYRKLLRAGFTSGEILRALKKRTPRADVLDEIGAAAEEQEDPDESPEVSH